MMTMKKKMSAQQKANMTTPSHSMCRMFAFAMAHQPSQHPVSKETTRLYSKKFNPKSASVFLFMDLFV